MCRQPPRLSGRDDFLSQQFGCEKISLVVQGRKEEMVALAAQESLHTAVETRLLLKVSRGVLSVALMAVSASCLLKYMWWTACYSAWSGIPKLAGQRRMAGANASFNGWTVILLEVVAIATLYSSVTFRSLSGFTRLGARIGTSLVFTAAGTAAFALLLSVIQIGVR